MLYGKIFVKISFGVKLVDKEPSVSIQSMKNQKTIRINQLSFYRPVLRVQISN